MSSRSAAETELDSSPLLLCVSHAARHCKRPGGCLSGRQLMKERRAQAGQAATNTMRRRLRRPEEEKEKPEKNCKSAGGKTEERRRKRRSRCTARDLLPEGNIDLIASFLRFPFSLSDKGRREDGAREEEAASKRQIRDGRRGH